MKIAVTGGAGFIGSHLVDRLVPEHEVVVVDDLSTGTEANLAEARAQGARLEVVDIASREARELLMFERPDTIFHLAAQMDVRKSVADPLADAMVNVVGTVNVLEAARAMNARVIFTSSGGTVYGETEGDVSREDDVLAPVSPYGAAKVSGETYVFSYARLFGLGACALALGNVYGPRQNPHGEAGVVAMFASALLEGRPTNIFGDGSAERDYIAVNDVVDALVSCLDGRADGQRLNIASGRATSVRQLHELVATAVGSPQRPVLAPARTGELVRNVLSTERAEQVLAWRATTSLAEGLVSTVEWVRAALPDSQQTP